MSVSRRPRSHLLPPFDTAGTTTAPDEPARTRGVVRRCRFVAARPLARSDDAEVRERPTRRRHEPGAGWTPGATPRSVSNGGSPFVPAPPALPPDPMVALCCDLARREGRIALAEPFLRQEWVRGGEVVHASKRLLAGAVRAAGVVHCSVDYRRAPLETAARAAPPRAAMTAGVDLNRSEALIPARMPLRHQRRVRRAEVVHTRGDRLASAVRTPASTSRHVVDARLPWRMTLRAAEPSPLAGPVAHVVGRVVVEVGMPKRCDAPLVAPPCARTIPLGEADVATLATRRPALSWQLWASGLHVAQASDTATRRSTLL